MPTMREVSAKSTKLNMDTTVFVNAPETLSEGVEMFGEEAMLSNAMANWTVTVQAGIRRGHTAGKSDEEIQTSLGEAKMGVAAAGGKIDVIKAGVARFALMTPEEQDAYLTKLREAAAKAQG